MDEITMVAALRPDAPDEAELNEMRAAARRRVTTAGRPRHPKRWLATGLTAAVAGAATAAVVLASGGTPAPVHLSTVVTAAWTVKGNADGTVTVEVRQLVHPARLQRVLRDDGINAFVLPIHYIDKKVGKRTYILPACVYYTSAAANYAPRPVQKAVVSMIPLPRHPLPDHPPKAGWIIHPAAMPAGSALFLTGEVVPGDFIMASTPQVLTSDTLPPCQPFHLPTGK
jgi:hypothetical protein